MTVRRLGVLVEGATGRLGSGQHLARALLPIARDGGLALSDGSRLVPEPVLLGRDAERLSALADRFGGLRWSTDRDACLSDPSIHVYFDASVTGGRFDRALAAVAAGRHVYLEKPVAETAAEARRLLRAARAAGVRHGVVCDKLHLPGVRSLLALREADVFGPVHAMRLDYGFWVFDGERRPCQRSSWNYRRSGGGGIVLDMFTHWSYLARRLVGRIERVTCATATRTGRRRDEAGRLYDVDVDDDVTAICETVEGALVTVRSSWATRAGPDEILEIRLDGARASALAGVHRCLVQTDEATSAVVWNADDAEAHARGLADTWTPVEPPGPPRNGFRAGWEAFLRHAAEGGRFDCGLDVGLDALALIEACHASARERRWVEVDGADGEAP